LPYSSVNRLNGPDAPPSVAYMENDRDTKDTPDPDLVTEETDPTQGKPTREDSLAEQVDDEIDPGILDDVLPEGTRVEGHPPMP
jgi:hypothetical protein